jgi:glucose 1-dehydrogenase
VAVLRKRGLGGKLAATRKRRSIGGGLIFRRACQGKRALNKRIPSYASCLSGQPAIVTGANSGIGRAIALELARAGADIAVNYVTDEDAAQTLVREVEALGCRAFAVRADVSREVEVVSLFQAVLQRFGTLHILVNCAGLQVDAPLIEMSLAQWNKVLDVNLTGQFLCLREAVREFRRRGIMHEISSAAGKVICISSVHQAMAWAGHANYAASKGGVMMLMRSAAQELTPHKIRVNGIAPGAIRTSINKDAWQSAEAREKLNALIPYGRIGEVEDIARAAVWLASDAADYVSGATLTIDGGLTLGLDARVGE